MLEKLWDDVVAGPRPETGLEKLRKAATTRPLSSTKMATARRATDWLQANPSMRRPRDAVTRCLCPDDGDDDDAAGQQRVEERVPPGEQLRTKSFGANLFDRPQPNSPTVYDWLYSDETRSSHR
uniref:Putative dormancy-asociated protein n=1 Tax=Oryza sativa TaxID=4530 RepID=Q8SA78_ORYSA|nr:putative dormancy-asociated protein [Oryza sativa]